MKKLLVLLTLVCVLVGGCVNGKVNLTPEQQTQLLMVTVKVGALNLGNFVGKSKTTADDIAIKDGYLLLRKGQLPLSDFNAALMKLNGDNPIIAANCLILLESMGAIMGPSMGDLTKSVIDLSKITPEMWDAAEFYYNQGFIIGQASQK